MDFQMSGKVALITGAAGGIGAATAKLFAAEGVRVALFDLDGPKAEALVAALNGEGAQAMGGALDVSDLDAFTAAVEAVEARWGGLDCLVNVAGGGTRQTLKTLTALDWRKTVDLNLTGPFNGIKAASPAMQRRGGGAIVTVASLASITMSMNNGVSYTAAKAGVLGLTRHAAFELGADNIRVNAVLPGPVLTPQMKAKLTPETLADVPRSLPLGRWVQPEEVANALLFFCSPMSSACTGTHFIVDGGLHIGAPRSRDEYNRTRDITARPASAG